MPRANEVNDELGMLIVDPEEIMIDWEQYQKESQEDHQCRSTFQPRLYSGWTRWTLVRCTKGYGHKGFHLSHGITWPTILQRGEVRINGNTNLSEV